MPISACYQYGIFWVKSQISPGQEETRRRRLFTQGINSLTVYRFKQCTASATNQSTATCGSGGTVSGSQSAAGAVKATRGAYSWGALVWRSGWFLCFLSSSSLLGWRRTRRRRGIWAPVQSLRRTCKAWSLCVSCLRPNYSSHLLFLCLLCRF